MAVCRYTAVNCAKNKMDSWNLREREQRPRPPNCSRDLHDAFRTAEFLSVHGQHDHFRQFQIRLQIQARARPRRLKRNWHKAASLQCPIEIPDGINTKGAVAVVKKPAGILC